MSTLVIVESPAKSHTLKKFLGDGYVILPSIGHIRDLPSHGLGIKINDTATHFEPQYEISEDKKKVVADIVGAAKKADTILLASDPDREGEAIAWHLDAVLRDRLGRNYDRKTVRRVTYNEITKSAVLAGIEHPRDIDMNLVDAQQCRRILDRLVGWRISRVLAKGIHAPGASAGRVQSPTLRLVCEREDAIAAFRPECYWEFAVKLRQTTAGAEPFTVRLRTLDGDKADIRDENAAGMVRSFLNDATYTAEAPTTGTKERRPGAPFATSDLQQAASSALHFSPSRTMSLAQRLYEAGRITYMRTDHHAVSREAMGMARDFIESAYGKEYSKPNSYQRHEAGTQGAHEAIRPTDVAVTADVIEDRDEARLYDLIRTRFLTSQMAPARYRVDTLRVHATVGGAAHSQVGSTSHYAEAVLTASAATVIFPGFLAATPDREKSQFPPVARKDGESGAREEADDTIASLPVIIGGERLLRDDVLDTRKETKPPAHFSEASLVKAMEKEGIGRPSTYASILSTLEDRRYVEIKGRNVLPTSLGRRAIDFLIEGDKRAPAGDGLFYIQYTRDMERTLDSIAHEETIAPEPDDSDDLPDPLEIDKVQQPVAVADWQTTLAEFYSKLKAWLEAVRITPPSEIFRVVLAKFLEVTEWEPPHTDGKRQYDDKKFVQGMVSDYVGENRGYTKAQAHQPYRFDPASKPAPSFSGTAPQLRYLLNILLRYRGQISGIDEGFADTLIALIPADSPDAETLRTVITEALTPRKTASVEEVDLDRAKAVIRGLEAIPGDRWEPPVTRRGRTYDDRAFFEDVAKGFRERGRIFPKALAALERMLARYKESIPDAQEIMERYGIAEAKPRRALRSATASAEASSTSAAAPAMSEDDRARAESLLAFFATITEWHPKRGRFDDKKFVASIRSQYQRGKPLSEKQLAALSKMHDRYAQK